MVVITGIYDEWKDTHSKRLKDRLIANDMESLISTGKLRKYILENTAHYLSKIW